LTPLEFFFIMAKKGEEQRAEAESQRRKESLSSLDERGYQLWT